MEAIAALRQQPRPELRGLRVLLATDESDGARAGEEWIRRLRWQGRASIDVLTVAPAPRLKSWLSVQAHWRGVGRTLEVHVGEALEVANGVGWRLQEAGHRIRVWAGRGEPPDEIVRASRIQGTDLIVVGSSSGPADAAEWGERVSKRVAETCDTAVLIATETPRGRYRLPRALMVVDIYPGAGAAALRWLQAAGWLAEQESTNPKLPQRDRPAGSSTMPLWYVAGEAPLMTALLPPDPDASMAGVRRFVEERGIDLVAIGRPGANARIPFGRVQRDRDVTDLAIRLAEEARVSVLLVPVG